MGYIEDFNECYSSFKLRDTVCHILIFSRMIICDNKYIKLSARDLSYITTNMFL